MFDTKGDEPERFYHGFVLGLIAGLRETHVIYSNRESGYGRYDVTILPREASRADRPGIIMEFKSVENSGRLNKEAESALAQIDRRWYQAELEQHNIRHILTIGMAFSGKEVAVHYAGSAKKGGGGKL